MHRLAFVESAFTLDTAQFADKETAAKKNAAYDGCSDLMCLLAHPVRLHILALLSHKPATVSQIVAATGRRQPNISQQLAILRAGGLVAGERMGRRVVYRLTSIELRGLLDSILRLGARDLERCGQASAIYLGVAQASFYDLLRSQIAWRPTVDMALCDGCGICVLACTQGVYAFDHARQKTMLVSPDACNVGCSTCATMCSPGAIALPSREAVLSAITGAVLAWIAAILQGDRRGYGVGPGCEAA